MDHACAEQFDPALALAHAAALAAALKALDIHLAAGLGEGEVMGAEAGPGFRTVQAVDELVQRALQVGEGDALVHHEPLDLMEHGAVGGVHLILAVDAAGRNDANGQGLGLHDVDLHGARLGAQQHLVLFVEVEGVLPVAGGMALFRVQTIEVVGGKLDLGALGDGEAHADEDLLGLADDLVQGMRTADADLFARHGNVRGLGGETHLERLFAQRAAAVLNGLGELLADLVCQLTHNGTLLGGELSHLLEQSGELALLAQVFDAQRLQRVERAGLPDRPEGFFPQLTQLLFHSVLLLEILNIKIVSAIQNKFISQILRFRNLKNR